MNGTEQNRRGRSVVVTLTVTLVTVAGVVGYMIGLVGPAALRPVTYLGLYTFEPTPLGLAAYGVLTVGTVLSVGILLVVLASRYDEQLP